MINKQVDYKLFFTVFALIIFWMIMISSVSVFSSFKVTSAMVKAWTITEAYNHFYVIRNITHVFISLTLLLFLVKVPYNFFEKYAKNIFIVNIILMFYVLFFWTTWNWATWWINVPFLPFALQPVEFLKFSLIICLAYYFKKYNSKLSSLKEWFVPFSLLLWFVVILLWLQPDFWSVLLIVPIATLMFFIWWAKLKYLLVCFILWIFLVLWVYNFCYYDKTNPDSRTKLSYITDRIDNFITDEKEQIKNKTINYQTEQWLIAIWSWGFSWLWFGNSIQKFWYLPEVQWDFIFSVIIEELWFIWWVTLLLFYAYIWYRGYWVSYYSPDLFAKFASFWITTWILTQACINIWVNLNIVPLTWLTLPFISYWWSSLMALMCGLWLLLNISRYVDENKWWANLRANKFKLNKDKVNMYNL